MSKTAKTSTVEQRVFGIYADFGSLRSALDRLKALRFRNRDISVLLPEGAVSKGLPAEQTVSAKAGRSGSFIGGTLAWLTYVRPARVGIISGALGLLGVPQRAAEQYERNLRSGLLLVCVRMSSAKYVKHVFEAFRLTGAEEVVAAISDTSPVEVVCADDQADLWFAGELTSSSLVC